MILENQFGKYNFGFLEIFRLTLFIAEKIKRDIYLTK